MESKSRVFIATWGRKGSENGNFSYPEGIAISSRGIIYVADTYNHRLLRSNQSFYPDGTFIHTWGYKGKSYGAMNTPTAVAIATRDGRDPYVLSALEAVPEFTSFPHDLEEIALSYVGQECVYVVDALNHRIQVFDMEGEFIHTWGTLGRGVGEFYQPNGCAVGIDTLIYVTDQLNHRIQVFDTNGRFIRQWGASGIGDGQFQVPTAITTDTDGLVYVADGGTHLNYRIQCLHPNGTFIKKWTPPSGLPLYQCSPYALLVYDRLMYVSDRFDHCVRVYRLDGTFLRKLGGDTYGDGDGQFRSPFGIAIADGIMYVCDAGNRRIILVRIPK